MKALIFSQGASVMEAIDQAPSPLLLTSVVLTALVAVVYTVITYDPKNQSDED